MTLPRRWGRWDKNARRKSPVAFSFCVLDMRRCNNWFVDTQDDVVVERRTEVCLLADSVKDRVRKRTSDEERKPICEARKTNQQEISSTGNIQHHGRRYVSKAPKILLITFLMEVIQMIFFLINSKTAIFKNTAIHFW